MTWTEPMNTYFNKETCNSSGTIKPFTPITVKVVEAVKKQIAKDESTTTLPTIDAKSAEAYKNFATELVNFEKNFITLNENNTEDYIKGVAEIFAKTSDLKFPNEYRQRHLIEVLQKYYTNPDSSRTKLEELSKKYNFAALTDWANKTKNLSENEIAWMDFGVVHGEYKITADAKIDDALDIFLYNYQGKKLDKSNLDIKVTISSTANASIKAEKKSEDNKIYTIVGEKVAPNETATATVSISQQNDSSLPLTTTFPIRFVKAIEVEEKTISSHDTSASLPNGFEWEVKSGLVKEDTKVKIIAKIKGDSLFYSVVYSNNIDKKVAPEGESGTIIIKSADSNTEGYWTGNYDLIDNYTILKYFFS